MASSDHTALLDQLQAQVHLILEQTGRVFAAVNSCPKVAPVAQITKLQNTLPIASKHFHQALDQLENELQTAALVMRRDLALCREQSSTSGKTLINESSEPLTKQNTGTSIRSPEAKVPGKTEDVLDEDILMEDQPPKSTPESTGKEEEPASDAKVTDSKAIESSTDNDPTFKEAKSNLAGEAVTGSGDLSIDTAAAGENSKADPNSGEEKAPDTATGDLDSLFNDPISAEDAAAPNAFDFDQNNSNELDFGSFGAGFDSTGAENDNISSLLPGLEDYANTQSNAAADVMDFSSFFDTADNNQNTGLDQQGSGEQRDTTFDDLMDLANFEGMDGDDSNNNNGNNHNADLDFEALFN